MSGKKHTQGEPGRSSGRWWVFVIFTAAVGLIGMLAASARRTPAIEGNEIVVYKSPSCGCCGKWVEHLEAHGFRVRVENSDNPAVAMRTHGVPEALASCHTAVVSGYVIEGHVPAPDILRLLLERAPVAGLAVPGMPAGSPGWMGRRSRTT